MAEKYLLLVEGSDEFVFKHLAEYYKLPDSFEIRPVFGVDKFLKLKSLRALLTAAFDAEKIGIILDADEKEATLRWGTLRSHLRQLGYSNVPNKLNPHGMVLEQSTQITLPSKVGVWIMPDNNLPGKIENFISLMIPNEQNNVLWNLAKNCVEEASKVSIPKRFAQKDRIKAEVYTWLAWQEQPGKPFGTAIKARYLDAEAANAKQLIDWLRNLFDL